MRVTFSISVDFEIDPQKLKENLNTEGLRSTEATKLLKDKVWRILDEEFSEMGRYGDYSREVRDDITEVITSLGVLADETKPSLNVSRPQGEL